MGIGSMGGARLRGLQGYGGDNLVFLFPFRPSSFSGIEKSHGKKERRDLTRLREKKKFFLKIKKKATVTM